MKPKLRRRFLRNLRDAIRIVESMHDEVRDADELYDDRRDALHDVDRALERLNLCKAYLVNDLHEYPS